MKNPLFLLLSLLLFGIAHAQTHKNTWKDAPVEKEVTSEMTLYRYFDSDKNYLGEYFTTKGDLTSAEAIEILALPPSSSACSLATYKLPPGVKYLMGEAAAGYWHELPSIDGKRKFEFINSNEVEKLYDLRTKGVKLIYRGGGQTQIFIDFKTLQEIWVKKKELAGQINAKYESNNIRFFDKENKMIHSKTKENKVINRHNSKNLPGGIAFGSKISFNSGLGKLINAEWEPLNQTDTSSGILKLIYANSLSLKYGPIPSEDLKIACEIISDTNDINSTYKEGYNINLVSILDSWFYKEITYHPKIYGTSLGNAFANVDQFADKDYTDEIRSDVDKQFYLLFNETIHDYYTDSGYTICDLNFDFSISDSELIINKNNTNCLYFISHLPHKRASFRKDSVDFIKLFTILERTSSDFHRVNDFSKILAITRYIFDSKVQLPVINYFTYPCYTPNIIKMYGLNSVLDYYEKRELRILKLDSLLKTEDSFKDSSYRKTVICSLYELWDIVIKHYVNPDYYSKEEMDLWLNVTGNQLTATLKTKSKEYKNKIEKLNDEILAQLKIDPNKMDSILDNTIEEYMMLLNKYDLTNEMLLRPNSTLEVGKYNPELNNEIGLLRTFFSKKYY